MSDDANVDYTKKWWDYDDLKAGYIAPHFRWTEFRCNHCDFYERPPEQLLIWLENIRHHFGDTPMDISSGCRCETKNKMAGGKPNSYHLKGMAADFYMHGVSANDVYDYANKLINSQGGVGWYHSFTHIDTRGYKARWAG